MMPGKPLANLAYDRAEPCFILFSLPKTSMRGASGSCRRACGSAFLRALKKPGGLRRAGLFESLAVRRAIYFITPFLKPRSSLSLMAASAR